MTALLQIAVISAVADSFLNRLLLRWMARKEKRLLPAWIFFVDEELKPQKFKGELHSLVLMDTAVFQKKVEGVKGK